MALIVCSVISSGSEQIIFVHSHSKLLSTFSSVFSYEKFFALYFLYEKLEIALHLFGCFDPWFLLDKSCHIFSGMCCNLLSFTIAIVSI